MFNVLPVQRLFLPLSSGAFAVSGSSWRPPLGYKGNPLVNFVVSPGHTAKLTGTNALSPGHSAKNGLYTAFTGGLWG